MNLKLQRIQSILRQSGLLPSIEYARYFYTVLKYFPENFLFKLKFPDFKTPPRWLAFDAYSAPDFLFYKNSGEKTAKFISDLIIQHSLFNANQKISMLEWGCGPARVIRHVPNLLLNSNIHATDYNMHSIDWCERNIEEVSFHLNSLTPPLDFTDDYFDVVYAISVITHLSRSSILLWFKELSRVLKPNGLLIVTSNGKSCLKYLLPDEAVYFRDNGYVIRDKVEEGKKMFWSCHSPEYMQNFLFDGFIVEKYSPANFPFTNQDYWILRKDFISCD